MRVEDIAICTDAFEFRLDWVLKKRGEERIFLIRPQKAKGLSKSRRNTEIHLFSFGSSPAATYSYSKQTKNK